MIDYRIAAPEDRESILDFINMVFSMLRVPHDFEAMLPKAYSETLNRADIHVIAEEDGKICGCLGMLTFPLTVCGETLQVGYLGSMSVHPRLRGQGVMKVLMEEQIARGLELGLDMLVLGGQRQRYQYYGFETCGATVGYSISAANMRHAMRDVDTAGLTFAPMAQADVPYALSLYNAQAVCGARTEESFLAAACSYRERPHILLKDAERAGYLIVSEDGQRITEILTGDEALLPAALKGYAGAQGIRSLRVDAAPHDVRLNALLAPICEGFTISPNSMLRVLRPERVIRAYMRLKQTMQPLADGRLVIGFGDMGAYEIAVQNGEVMVAETAEKPDAALGGLDAHQLLFGYNRFGVPAAAEGIAPAGWFPLPYSIPEPDSF